MSKLSKAASQMREEKNLRLNETVKNFMGGDSYVINPLDTLKMISASSIFGEPSYYRDSKSTCSIYVHNSLVTDDIFSDIYDRKSVVEIMTEAIDASLDYDFKATIEWAVELRSQFYMRLNPQVIMVRAAIHPKRQEFTKENPGMFNAINKIVMSRADDPMSQMAYYLYNNDGDKSNIPSILKRSWSKKISNLSDYEIAKYKNHEIGLINAVRICHAHSQDIDELMRTGTFVSKSMGQMTWENYISRYGSNKESWETVIDTIFTREDPTKGDFMYDGIRYKVKNHMAILRNLRNMAKHVDEKHMKKILEALKASVIGGKQFPFRYFSAINATESASGINYKPLIIDALEECMDISLENFPKLKGKTMCLSDNSGSAWGTCTSEYGTVKVAHIDNLSSVIAAANSDEGYVGKFGDTLKVFPISKRRGVLDQAQKITQCHSNDVGGSTEGGIWEFFRDAIDKKEHWDNIFIYSDQQAGTGGLYGTHSQASQYNKRGFSIYGGYSNYINVYKLILEYRKKVNPKVNVFSVQTAGYDNVVIPEYGYRTNLMYGWTGKEIIFADAIIKQWDEIENNHKNN